jgi:hypothetical protein
MLNVDELKKLNEKRKNFKLEAYEKILEMICNKIKDTSTVLGENYCIYQVPEFLLGYSLYELDDCCKWLKKKILKFGINKVTIIEKNILIIMWD